MKNHVIQFTDFQFPLQLMDSIEKLAELRWVEIHAQGALLKEIDGNSIQFN